MPLYVAIVLFLFLSPGFEAHAQFYNQRPEHIRANRMWIFGMQAGLDFQTSPPQAFVSPLIIGEGISVACSPVNGALQFYSDGRTVRNRMHAIMPNGSGITGNNGSTIQGACVVPVPGSAQRFLLFSLEYEGDPGRLFYSEIDLSLNGGLGDVVTGRKNIYLDSNLGEGMMAVPGDNCDIWLLVHTRADPVFKAYRITAAGIDSAPVISDTGPNPISGRRGTSRYYNAFGINLMQVAPDRTRIAISSAQYGFPAGQPGQPPITGVMICRFDPATGRVSHPVGISDAVTNNICFSPDGNLLYLARPESATMVSALYQYEIQSHDSATIAGTGMHIADIPNPYSPSNYQAAIMRLYNDTVYLCGFQTEAIHRINRPNLRGAACDLQQNVILLAPGAKTIQGFPSDVVYPMDPDTLHHRHDTAICTGQRLYLSVPAGARAIRWDDGSTADTRQVTAPGTYHVLASGDCHLRIDTFVAAVRQTDTVFAQAADTLLCNTGSFALHAPDSFDRYRWQTGDTGRVLHTTGRGIISVWSERDCLARRDSFVLRGRDLRFSLGADTLLCAGDTLHLRIPVAGAYSWQDGTRDPGYAVTVPGVYAATVVREECAWSDTVVVSEQTVIPYLGNDRRVCSGEPVSVILDPEIQPGIRLRWSDGSTGSILHAADTGTYWVRVCSSADTVRIFAEHCSCEATIPNAFTPNEDGRNDLFRVLLPGGCPAGSFRMSVYNRWGQEVFVTDNIQSGWDGRFRGLPAETGSYRYQVSVETGTRKTRQFYQGDLLLLR